MAQKYQVKRLAADGQLNGTDEVWIKGIQLVAGADAATLEITEDADGSGTNVLVVKCPANDSKWVDLSGVGGLSLSQGYGDLSGTSPEAYIFWE